MRKVLVLVLMVLTMFVLVSVPVLANDNCDRCCGKIEKFVAGASCGVCRGVNAVGGVTNTVIVRAPAAVLETGGDAARTVGGACDLTAGLLRRTGDRVFSLFRCCSR